MNRPLVILEASFVFAVASSVLVAVHLVFPQLGVQAVFPSPPATNSTGLSYYLSAVPYNLGVASRSAPFRFLLTGSPFLATGGWAVFGGVWMWRGRTRAKWESLGFDSQTFDLFMRMKGARTRLSLLGALSMPRDRMQLAQELGLDWKAVDYHIVIFERYGLVHEDRAYGKVKMYRLTRLGEDLLQLLKEVNKAAELPNREPLTGL